MVKGELEDNRPYITIPIRWGGRVQDIPALIDTGFDGDVRVSHEEAKYLNLITEHVQVLEFADGSAKDVPGSIGYSEFNGVVNLVNITILDGGATIGMGFLKKFNAILTINLKQKSVTIS
ncbi:MAG: hypothetical protein A3C02_00560 [Candidatus Andersenbacteria bacterium RIFCSPHIGHO2_02_FULL_45_11]|uniref:Peptidase A2 domain-containing protein n=1 Tax=Candidatus Andersenbacteria bacterium RIFCSPHIGHO2_12_FULL_45_11 TaxID=1797281 RepID=A0A1G1X212_9BACT|nr:MAG: hypothetical protein A2805_02510 [Candidatus Andersenbacteria bacterium RIFCSPHIGHO2_01_FULL_46_36]OGY31892.1 MAG: hypothetical protein A3C02_00560 [Candidatus Andersenbacteria bacterium RIFCSPHIGHO2_02_FULL_45_11]OGY34039.1 MAG: hypothetical protein A3D99_02160 [Candidatus Andersenbacteria bacterium RIFCSPHIGHO2_12_FULL_45_11]